ncbi:MAG: anaerobic ribonucleoside-triphosphate reductase activating protein [Lachnospiraceae bacterium]|nr:anaerobic ribonucleoside-triphosphate reductase activating protein [Lachnospiraceae bacterium]
MRYGQIYYTDIANGPGCRTSLFVSGCTHHCKGCFNEETWDFSFGHEYTKEVENQVLESVKPSYISGLTVLGGEPMEPENQRALISLYRRVREKVPHATIWIYSGYTWEELTDKENKRCHCEVTDEILSLTDVLVDGEFIEDLKDISLHFRGSSNQRLIDVPASLAADKVVLAEA